MDKLSSHEIACLLLSLGVLIAAARSLGELARRFNQPSVIGELIAGILLGPTVLGAWLPDLTATLFPRVGAQAAVLDALGVLAVTLFLMVAGMEVNLSVIWREGRSALLISLAGIVVPFGMGWSLAWQWPESLGMASADSRMVFAIFFATAMSISALPVIAKTLMDLNLFRSDMGMIIIAAAVLNDLAGWIIFAVLLGSFGDHGSVPGHIASTVGMTIAFTLFVLTVGRWLLHRAMGWIATHSDSSSGLIGFALSLALAGAAATEWIGIHAVFGAFLVGVALGDSDHLREQTRSTISQFISFIFAPLFFAMIGLKVNFVTHFDLPLNLAVLIIACVGKVVGCGLGARLTGMGPRESWAIGFGMNARGAMEIILGLLALEAGLIGERVFVALVVMALVTSMISGPAMQRILGLRKRRRLSALLSPEAFVLPLHARDRFDAIGKLSRAAGRICDLPADYLEGRVAKRERLSATGVGNLVAVPHARLPGLNAPVIAVGVSPEGIDFDAPDGLPSRLIFLVLTPENENAVQVEILSEIARTFQSEDQRQRALQCADYDQFLTVVKGARLS